MEKIDVLFIGLVIFVIVASLYIAYLKAGINFLIDMLAKQQVGLEELLKAMEVQSTINEKQTEINKELAKALGEVTNSPTGGRKQSN